MFMILAFIQKFHIMASREEHLALGEAAIQASWPAVCASEYAGRYSASDSRENKAPIRPRST